MKAKFVFEAIQIDNLSKDLRFLEYIEDELGKGYSECISEPKAINQGFCIYAAKYLKNKYPEAQFWTIGNDFLYHVFLEIDGKFYDYSTDVINLFNGCGFELFDKVIIDKSVNYRISMFLKQADRLGYTVKLHEYILIFKKVKYNKRNLE